MTTWTDAQLASIDKTLNPKSIAVVGATPRMTSPLPGPQARSLAAEWQALTMLSPASPRHTPFPLLELLRAAKRLAGSPASWSCLRGSAPIGVTTKWRRLGSFELPIQILWVRFET